MPSVPISNKQFIEILGRSNERDKLYYSLLYFMGLRPSEGRLIKISEINFAEKTLFIPAKNNKEHQEDNFPIPEFLIDPLFLYIRKYKLNEWLFPRKADPSLPVGYRTLQQSFRKRIPKQLSFVDKQGRPRYSLNLYSFRKNFGTRAYKKLGAIETEKLLRHRDPQMKSLFPYARFAVSEERTGLMEQLYPKGLSKDTISEAEEFKT